MASVGAPLSVVLNRAAAGRQKAAKATPRASAVRRLRGAMLALCGSNPGEWIDAVRDGSYETYDVCHVAAIFVGLHNIIG